MSTGKGGPVIFQLELRRLLKPGEVPKKNISQVSGKNAAEVYLIDKPGSPSSIILGGLVTLPKARPEEIVVEIMNMILGGQFSFRINMNLRTLSQDGVRYS